MGVISFLHMKNAPPTNNTFTRLAIGVWMMTLALVLIGRIVGPSDLGQNLDQSKTIAFTVDMVEHGQWILPRDSLGALTRKPPLVNWVGAPIVAIGLHNELALKLPSVLAGVSTSLMVFFIARFLFRLLATQGDPQLRDAGDRSIASHASALGWLAAAIWLASPSAIKHVYFMRPDMLFTALLTGSWVCSVVLLTDEQSTKPVWLAMLIWGLAGFAALTKGPLAMIVPIYLILHILIITPSARRRDAIASTRWYWGLPLMLALPVFWLMSAYRINPEHVTGALLGQELSSRVGNSGLGGIMDSMIKVPGFFFERFLPWCLPAALAIIFKPSSKLRSHPLAPAVLWTLIVLGSTALTGLAAGSYIMPAYPAGAVLAAYTLYRLIIQDNNDRSARGLRMISFAILLSAVLITGREITQSRGARTGTGDSIKSFADSAARLIKDDGVRFNQMGDLPIASLMGLHQPGDLTQAPSHRWLIEPTHLHALDDALLVSDPIVTHDPITGKPIGEQAQDRITIGLYRIAPASPAAAP